MSECPRCKLSPAYRRVLADPWGRHEVCADCSYDYSVATAIENDWRYDSDDDEEEETA